MTTILLGLACWWLGFLGGFAYVRLAAPVLVRHAIERAYDAGWEDGREVIMAPETRIQVIAVPPPVPGRPGATAPHEGPRRDRPYLNGPPPSWRADIGPGWSLDTIWTPPWELVNRLPSGSWLRALLAEACTMPPHKALR